jgi:hypothetical protein
VRICNLLLGPPFGRLRLADRLDEATEQLGAELATRQEVDAALEALWTLAVRVRDLVLDRADGLDATVANRVHWGTQSALVAALSHFPELETDLELLGSRCNTDMM